MKIRRVFGKTYDVRKQEELPPAVPERDYDKNEAMNEIATNFDYIPSSYLNQSIGSTSSSSTSKAKRRSLMKCLFSK